MSHSHAEPMSDADDFEMRDRALLGGRKGRERKLQWRFSVEHACCTGEAMVAQKPFVTRTPLRNFNL